MTAQSLARAANAAAKRDGFGTARLFGPQRAYAEDPARYKFAVCSGRAGKTYGAAVIALDVARTKPNANVGYVTLTRRSARNIIWEPLLQFNDDCGLGGEARPSELTMYFPKNRGSLSLHGANNVREINKLRGIPWDLLIIDEAQSFGPVLGPLVNDVIPTRLVDRLGTLCLQGTPGAVQAGPFWDEMQRAERGGYSMHRWGMRDNAPMLGGRDFMAIVTEECRRRGVAVDDPSIQREYFGQWAVDLDALVFRLTAQNHYRDVPPDLDRFIIAIDVGYDDADAIAVLGWQSVTATPRVYLVEEHVNRQADVVDLGNRVSALWNKYRPQKTVIDTGGLGKKTAVTLERRWRLPIEPAEKAVKIEGVKILRDMLSRGEFVCSPTGQFALDALIMQWAVNQETGQRKLSDKDAESKSFHSDIIDAVIYGCRETRHFFAKAPVAAQPEQEVRRAQRLRYLSQVRENGTGLHGGDLMAGTSDLWASNDVGIFG